MLFHAGRLSRKAHRSCTCSLPQWGCACKDRGPATALLAKQDRWAAFSTSDSCLYSTCGLCLVLGRARRAVQAGRLQEGMPLLIAQGLCLLPNQLVRQRGKVVPHRLTGQKR